MSRISTYKSSNKSRSSYKSRYTNKLISDENYLKFSSTRDAASSVFSKPIRLPSTNEDSSETDSFRTGCCALLKGYRHDIYSKNQPRKSKQPIPNIKLPSNSFDYETPKSFGDSINEDDDIMEPSSESKEESWVEVINETSDDGKYSDDKGNDGKYSDDKGNDDKDSEIYNNSIDNNDKIEEMDEISLEPVLNKMTSIGTLTEPVRIKTIATNTQYKPIKPKPDIPLKSNNKELDALRIRLRRALKDKVIVYKNDCEALKKYRDIFEKCNVRNEAIFCDQKKYYGDNYKYPRCCVKRCCNPRCC